MKIKLENFSKELAEALKKAKQELLSETSLQSIGNDIAEQIKTRTRLGNGLDVDKGEPSKLNPLSSGYVKQRKKLKLSQFTSVNKSNLTQTGQMLDSIVAETEGSKITITFSNQESKNKARWNTEKGRPFLHIARVQIERLRNDLDKKLQELLKKYI